MFSERLRLVRESIGLSQEEFSKLGGVQISAQANYERGHRSPSVDYLLALMDSGIDIVYILTGETLAYGLDSEEYELLKRYKKASPQKKYGIRLMARASENHVEDEFKKIDQG